MTGVQTCALPISIIRIQPSNVDAILLLADVYERMGDKKNAVTWYSKSLSLVKLPSAKTAIEKRIEELKK